jgi:HSP20 family molecular chaperone IbpA
VRDYHRGTAVSLVLDRVGANERSMPMASLAARQLMVTLGKTDDRRRRSIMERDPQKWSPFRELDRARNDFEELLDRFLGSRTSREQRGPFTPALESFIDSGKLVIRAELPGVDPKDVDITVTGDQLTIRGTREQRIDG